MATAGGKDVIELKTCQHCGQSSFCRERCPCRDIFYIYCEEGYKEFSAEKPVTVNRFMQLDIGLSLAESLTQKLFKKLGYHYAEEAEFVVGLRHRYEEFTFFKVKGVPPDIEPEFYATPIDDPRVPKPTKKGK